MMTAPAQVATVPQKADLKEIQGNILAGFNKDYQSFLFLDLGTEPSGARQWLRLVTEEVATTEEVQNFNELFKLVNSRRTRSNRDQGSAVKATWLNLALTHAGLDALGVPDRDLQAFPADFSQGMAKRAALLNDFGTSAPDEWFPAFTSDDLDALLIIASDTRADLDAEVSFQVERLAATGMRLLRIERGATRRDLPGHEHFGFKDGVSQPGIVGFTKNNSQDENQGDPGQDLLFPGEFVLGYSVQQPPPPTPKQDNGYPPKPAPTPAPGSGVHDPGPPPELKPVWTRNGSFLVFRRLSQDVPRFNDFLDKHAGNLGLVRLGSALVGRHKSGCPVEMIADLPTMATAGNVDPAIANPEVLDPRHINNFEFGADQVGTNVPLAAHIRKAYPRNQTHPGEQETQTHRLLRRGIPFGAPFVPGAAHDDPASETAPRGLLFLCYQASIERQFEFVQQSWVNKTDFPEPGQGIDPIIGQPATNTERHVTLPELPQPLGLEQFVRMTGGQYFFQPSISALRQLAASE